MDVDGGFTGDVKVVFYVRDVLQAVTFYTDALGFKFHHYFDHVENDSVVEWQRAKPPIYAEMSFAGRRFGLHSPVSDADERSVGAAKVYFRVTDLERHRRRVAAGGADPGELKERPWMDMFQVTDQDGNRLFFASSDDDPWFGE